MRAASGISVVLKTPNGAARIFTITAAKGDQLASRDETALGTSKYKGSGRTFLGSILHQTAKTLNVRFGS